MKKVKVTETEFLNYVSNLTGIHATEKTNNSMSFVDDNNVEFGRIVYGEQKEWYIFK